MRIPHSFDHRDGHRVLEFRFDHQYFKINFDSEEEPEITLTQEKIRIEYHNFKGLVVRNRCTPSLFVALREWVLNDEWDRFRMFSANVSRSDGAVMMYQSKSAGPVLECSQSGMTNDALQYTIRTAYFEEVITKKISIRISDYEVPKFFLNTRGCWIDSEHEYLAREHISKKLA